MKKYAVIGSPISHSLSPQIHELFAEEAGIDMICTSHDAPQFGIYNSFDELIKILTFMHRP